MTFPHPMDDATGFEATDAQLGLTWVRPALPEMDISVTQCEWTGYWQAIDRNTYECDCDENGYFCTDVVGDGKTPLDAIVDLLDKKEDRLSC